MKPTLGKFAGDDGAATIDLQRLLETRLLIQANSGGGKSWAIRRLLEQTAGQVQQLVIDPEGEFPTLRERFDYVIAAAHDGDAVAHPRSAALLARRLLETGVSAILDIYDLKAHERQAFVRLFCEALVNAPKSLWRPTLVVLDEAHVFCPEAGKAESAGAVIDLATRGRKRGFALIAATQRLAKLHKDTAAELLNKLIGRTGLDVDVRRAADELGMTPREAMEKLRALDPGDFYAFGPALSPVVRQLRVGDVQTSHPKAGKRILQAPPKPTAAIKAVLPKLADLPKEAAQEQKTLEDLRRELAGARRELTLAKRAQPVAGPNREDLVRARAEGIEAGRAAGRSELIREITSQVVTIGKLGETLLLRQHELVGKLEKVAPAENPASQGHTHRPGVARIGSQTGGNGGRTRLHRQIDAGAAPTGNGSLPPARQRILDKLAWCDQRGVYPPRKETLAAVCGASARSSAYTNNLGALRSAGLIDYPAPGLVELTKAGQDLARITDDDRTMHEHWFDVVTPAQRRILEHLVARHPTTIGKSDLAEAVGASAASSAYTNNLGRLRTLGAIDYPSPGLVALTRHVMPE